MYVHVHVHMIMYMYYTLYLYLWSVYIYVRVHVHIDVHLSTHLVYVDILTHFYIQMNVDWKQVLWFLLIGVWFVLMNLIK